MASAAEQLAANLNFVAFAKAELKKRIWFTLAALIKYFAERRHDEQIAALFAYIKVSTLRRLGGEHEIRVHCSKSRQSTLAI